MQFLFRTLALAALASSAWSAPVDFDSDACEPQELGQGPVSSPGTAEAFQALSDFSDAARSANTPVGYMQVLSNVNFTYNEPTQFIDYMKLDTYDVTKCAQACTSQPACKAFNVFFERSPTIRPGPYCPNPPSTTLIKCDLWSGMSLRNKSLNYGQYREDFRTVVAGSNAYVQDIDDDLPDIPGYYVEAYKHGAAITAPLGCNGEDTYLGVSYWHDGEFNITRCLDACEQSTANEINGRQCHFMNTYMQRHDGVPYTQHCALYSVHWPAQYATNSGQGRGLERIDVGMDDNYGVTANDGIYEACETAASLHA